MNHMHAVIIRTLVTVSIIFIACTIVPASSSAALDCNQKRDLRGTDLSRCDLHDANLFDANLHMADLRGADMFRADLNGANLEECNLTGACLG